MTQPRIRGRLPTLVTTLQRADPTSPLGDVRKCGLQPQLPNSRLTGHPKPCMEQVILLDMGLLLPTDNGRDMRLAVIRHSLKIIPTTLRIIKANMLNKSINREAHRLD